MLQRGSVVPETSGVTEDQFHGAMVAGLGRAEAKVGRNALAFVMSLKSLKALANIFAGTAPHPKRLWDARSADATVLDDVADLYDCRIVHKDHACARCADQAAPALVNALQKVIAADVDGHRTHQELLGMEDEVRAARAVLDGLIEQIDGIRKPRAVR